MPDATQPAAAGAAPVDPVARVGNPGETGCVTFAHLSDLHLSQLDQVRAGDLTNKRILGYISWRRRRQHEHKMAVLERLRERLLASPLQQILITGDLTQLGMPDEYRQARSWLDRLGAAGQVALVPGNHDHYVRMPWATTGAQWLPYMQSDPQPAPTMPDQQREADWAHLFPSLRVRDGVAFIGLSSAIASKPFLATGRLGEDQLKRLAQVLAVTGRQGLFRVVYLHHPPLEGVEKHRKRLLDIQPLIAVIDAAGAELLLHGHVHKTHLNQMLSQHRQIPVCSVPSASALGLHGEAAAYDLYRLFDEGEAGWRLCRTPYRYEDGRQSFEPEPALEWRIRRPAD